MSNIKHEKGKVFYEMRTGANFVRNYMPLASAKSIVNRSKNVEETDKRGYGVEICVDDKYFFPIEELVVKEEVEEKPTKSRKNKDTDEVAE